MINYDIDEKWKSMNIVDKVAAHPIWGIVFLYVLSGILKSGSFIFINCSFPIILYSYLAYMSWKDGFFDVSFLMFFDRLFSRIDKIIFYIKCLRGVKTKS